MYPEEIEAFIHHALGQTHYDVIRVAVSGRRQVQVVIDKDPPGPILVQDLTNASRKISQSLAEHGLDPRSFHIQCQSPGIDRLLTRPKDFLRFSGSMVRAKAKRKINGRKTFTGVLLGWHGEQFFIRLGDGSGDFGFSLHDVAEVRIVPTQDKRSIPQVL